MSLEQAQSILEGKKLKGINRDDEKDWINRVEDVSLVLTAGIVQFQFVHIHPGKGD